MYGSTGVMQWKQQFQIIKLQTPQLVILWSLASEGASSSSCGMGRGNLWSGIGDGWCSFCVHDGLNKDITSFPLYKLFILRKLKMRQ
jgi:hypothetical protein